MPSHVCTQVSTLYIHVASIRGVTYVVATKSAATNKVSHAVHMLFISLTRATISNFSLSCIYFITTTVQYTLQYIQYIYIRNYTILEHVFRFLYFLPKNQNIFLR
jgi:hypothetical protein